MLEKTFYIQRKAPAKSWYFDENSVVDISKLELTLWKYANKQNRYWSILINGFELLFEYSPDLTTIFDELPQVLEELLQDNQEPVELFFFEQGTDLSLWLARDGDTIWVSFEKHLFCGEPYRRLPEGEPQPVLASDFYSAWFEFLDELLETLVQQEPSLAHDESYLYYTQKINSIKRKARFEM